MEFGPRALGNRSFLADPRRADMRELLNDKVKLREWFRPLAPSMRRGGERGRLRPPPLRPVHDHRASTSPTSSGCRLPSIVHVDGTARPRRCGASVNPRYWQLLREFEKLSGVPVLLNTSFNVQEPIVCTPADAVRTFLGANFDALVLENHLVLSSAKPSPA